MFRSAVALSQLFGLRTSTSVSPKGRRATNRWLCGDSARRQHDGVPCSARIPPSRVSDKRQPPPAGERGDLASSRNLVGTRCRTSAESWRLKRTPHVHMRPVRVLHPEGFFKFQKVMPPRELFASRSHPMKIRNAAADCPRRALSRRREK